VYTPAGVTVPPAAPWATDQVTLLLLPFTDAVSATDWPGASVAVLGVTFTRTYRATRTMVAAVPTDDDAVTVYIPSVCGAV
jgi:hypothetical protein